MNTKLSTNRKLMRMSANILSIVVILALAFPAWGSAYAEEEPPPAPWRDEFDGPLGGDWYWQNEDADKWTFNDGFLSILASPLGTGGENLLLRPVAPGDFMIKTHLIFEPDTDFQFAGLIIWEDGENFLQLGRAFCDVDGSCVGNGLYFDKILGGELVDGNFATTIDNPSDVFLRLERRGDMVRAFYSADEGISWYEVGTHWIPSDFQVNAVGLTASQDFSNVGIPADFDFFELTEGWGFLPEGFHDYDSGDVPSWACNAGGWAADPDDRSADVNVEVVVDHQTVATLAAGEFRQDLLDAGVCEDGNCSFHTELWDAISSYEPHRVDIWAQDTTRGDWVLLSNSAKTLTCRTYDIYAFDPMTGETVQITNLRETDEYNPSWSPNGKLVAHDVVGGDFHSIYITNVKTGVSTPLAGADDFSDDAVWSPNGKWIVFDRVPAEDYSLYIVSAAGGVRALVREDAVSADWAPSGKRLVFQQPSDGSIRTIPMDGGKSGETLIAASGANPSWSPDGNWIAYESGGDIWKVQVNVQGSVFGDPIQVTSGAFADGQPTWSADSMMIIYHSGFNSDWDLWSVPALGGMPTWLSGAPNFSDYDPANAKNSFNIAYASFSPDGQAARLWVAAYTYDPPAGTFSEGTHPYHFDFEWSVPEPGGWSGQEGEIDVSNGADPYNGFVLLRGPFELRGVNTPEGLYCEEVAEINPGQPTRFLVGWLPDAGDIGYSDARARFENTTARAVWDDTQSAELTRHEIIPFRGDDWFNYVCAFTEAPPKMDLRVNYGHDWVESFYEAGHAVSIQVIDSEGNPKATAEVFTAPREEWGGEPGFQTIPDNWSLAPPDLQPYDWVYAQVDNGASARVQIGDISGMIDLDADSIGGTINAPWFSDPVQVECFDWGSGQDPPFDNADGGFILPNGANLYSCSWEEWDIQYYQNVGVGYFGADGHWVANAYFVSNPHFTVFPLWEWYDAMDWPEGATVAVAVEGKAQCSFERESPGNFFNGGFPAGCDITVGDTVTFTDGATTRTHVVRNLAVTSIDLDEDTISGTANVDTTVFVWPHDGWFEPLQAVANDSGMWQVDLGAVDYDIQEGASGRSEIRDDMDNATAVDWSINPRIIVHTEDDWFRAEGFMPNTSLDFWIYDAFGGNLLLGSSTAQTDSGGTLTHWVGDQLNIVPGNQVVVSDGTSMRDIVLEALTFDVFDTTQGILQGTAPAPFGRTVSVGIGCWARDDLTMDVTTDENGVWMVNFGAPVPTDFGCVFAWIFDEEGDSSEARPQQIIAWGE